MKISVVTPLFRSAPYIEELFHRSVEAIRATGASEHEIIFVNDDSPDDSLDLARRIAVEHPGVVVIDLARNYGQHKAIMTGLEAASGDYVFVMDSDLDEEPEWITKFYHELIDRKCDVVYGVQQRRIRGLAYRFCRWLFYCVLNGLSSVRFPKDIVTARLMSRRYVDALLQFGEREVWIAGLWHMTGFTQIGVAVDKNDTSPTTYTFTALAKSFINAITAFSTRPLTIIAIVGIAVSLIAFIFTGWVLYRKLVDGIAVEGWASVMSAVLLIGGMSLFFNGVMAIYVAKIFIEVKQRPRTIVREVVSSSVLAGNADNASDLAENGGKPEISARV